MWLELKHVAWAAALRDRRHVDDRDGLSRVVHIRICIRMCISVKKFQRTKIDVSQKPLIQKMHTRTGPEILNRGIEGYDAGSELPLADSPATVQ